MATIAVAGGCSGSLRAAVRARRRRRTVTTTAVAGTGAVAVLPQPATSPLPRSGRNHPLLVGCTMVSFYVFLALLGTDPVLSTAPV